LHFFSGKASRLLFSSMMRVEETKDSLGLIFLLTNLHKEKRWC